VKEKRAQEEALYRMLKERRCAFYCPGDGEKWEILLVHDDGILVKKEDGDRPFIKFNERMKPEHFT
jgi:hypothetical protein